MHVIILCFSFLFTLARVARVSRLREQVQGTIKKRTIKSREDGKKDEKKKKDERKKSDWWTMTLAAASLLILPPSWANWSHGTFIYFALKPL